MRTVLDYREGQRVDSPAPVPGAQARAHAGEPQSQRLRPGNCKAPCEHSWRAYLSYDGPRPRPLDDARGPG